MPDELSADDFLEAFRTGALPLSDFNHRAHVRPAISTSHAMGWAWRSNGSEKR